MMVILRASVAVCLLFALFVAGCSDIPANIDGGTADGDTDSDTDSDTDTDTDSYPYGDPCAGEVEVDGVFWCRCDVGQTWNGETCEGDSKSFIWESASESCPEGYLMPYHNKYAELLGNCVGDFDDDDLIFCDRCDQSDSCISVFEYTPQGYWTATPQGEMDNAWAVVLFSGEFHAHVMDSSGIVRCIRY